MDVVMPQLGETVENGTILQWFKKPGDRVSTDEVLFEVETDKVTMEIPSLVDGIVSEILVPEGQTVDVGTTLAIILTSATDMNDGSSDIAAPTSVTQTSHNAATETGHRKSTAQEPSSIAREVDDQTDVQVVDFSDIRRRTAEHMVRSKATSPHVLQAVEVNFELIDAFRARTAARWKADKGYPLTYLPFIARTVCIALRDYPLINATVNDSQLMVHSRINLAIAVDLNFNGLVAPVVKSADGMDVQGLAHAINDISQRARARKLRPDDLTEGTYTISNSGSFGTLITAPIINQPQVAILSTDGIRKKAVVVETSEGDEIAIRPVGILAQSFDHRAIDGAYSAAFPKCVRETIEKRAWSLNA